MAYETLKAHLAQDDDLPSSQRLPFGLGRSSSSQVQLGFGKGTATGGGEVGRWEGAHKADGHIAGAMMPDCKLCWMLFAGCTARFPCGRHIPVMCAVLGMSLLPRAGAKGKHPTSWNSSKWLLFMLSSLARDPQTDPYQAEI